MDQFRGPLGSAAIAILLAFFASSPNMRESDKARVDWCKQMLENWCFIYAKADRNKQKVSSSALGCISTNGLFDCRGENAHSSRA